MKKKLCRCLAICIALASLLPGCEQQAASPGDGPLQVTSFSVGTSTMTGTYYIMGGPISQIINDKMDGYSATHEATDGPAANLQMIENGEMYLALTSVLSAYQGYNGIGFAEELGTTLTSSRALFMTHNSFYQCMTLRSMNINSHRDLDGKIVDVTKPGSTPYIALMDFIDALEIQPRDILYSTLAQSIEGMKDNQVHNGLAVTGYPNGAMQDFAASYDTVLVDFSQEEIDAILAKYPYYSTAVIPAGTYKGQAEDVRTFQFWNMLVGHKDLPEEFVYDLLTQVYDNVDLFTAAHADAEVVPERILESQIPLHAGAVRYYRERGIDIPDGLVPPEMS